MTDVSQTTPGKVERKGLALALLALAAVGVALVGSALAAAILWKADGEIPAAAVVGQWWFFTLLARLPLYWIVSSALGLVVAYVAFRVVRLGFRTRAIITLVVALVGAGAAATLFHQLGMDASLKLKAPDVQSIVKKVIEQKCAQWNQPVAGSLGGRVTGQDDTGLVLMDPAGKSWYVTTTATTPGLEYAQFLQNVRVEGERGEDGYFIARQIRPWAYQVPGQPPAPADNNIAGPCKDVARK